MDMPYKDKEQQKKYQKQWEEKNRENRTWAGYLWHKDHQEHKNELDRKSWQRHKDYHNWVRRFTTKLTRTNYFEILDTKNDKL